MFKSNAHREDLEMICSYAKVYMNKASLYSQPQKVPVLIGQTSRWGLRTCFGLLLQLF